MKILLLLTELVKWGRVWLELKSRTLLYDKKKEVEREIKELGDEIEKLRRNGKHSDADRLLLSQVRSASFERALSNLAKGYFVDSTRGHDLGGSASGEDKGSDDPGVASGS